MPKRDDEGAEQIGLFWRMLALASLLYMIIAIYGPFRNVRFTPFYDYLFGSLGLLALVIIFSFLFIFIRREIKHWLEKS